LSRIINLLININKYNPLHAGCHIELSQEIKLKRAVVNVQTTDNACFAWSVVALHPAERKSERESSYPHYSTVLNLKGIELPITLTQIKNLKTSTTFPSTCTVSRRKRNSQSFRFDSPRRKWTNML